MLSLADFKINVANGIALPVSSIILPLTEKFWPKMID
jgi:hypothetical protein